ncbi:protoporphyrinogen oxidase [Streptomyces sp. M19]
MSAPRTPPSGHVIVIGGGISGLAAAHRLVEGGARVTVLEASGRLGGKLHAGEIAGMPVDLGAESMLARRPEAVDLARAVGLADRLQPPATTSAALWTRGALRQMPTGHVMGVPGDTGPLAASGVLSEEGLARIGRDAELPAPELGEDVAIGAFVAERFGREVVDRLVEPLLGGVYAGNAYRISMRAAVPHLFAAARESRSLTEGVRAVQRRTAAAADRQSGGPVFMGIDGGIGRLPLAVADAVRAAGGRSAPAPRYADCCATRRGRRAGAGREGSTGAGRSSPTTRRCGPTRSSSPFPRPRRAAARRRGTGRRRGTDSRGLRLHGAGHPGVPPLRRGRVARPERLPGATGRRPLDQGRDLLGEQVGLGPGRRPRPAGDAYVDRAVRRRGRSEARGFRAGADLARRPRRRGRAVRPPGRDPRHPLEQRTAAVPGRPPRPGRPDPRRGRRAARSPRVRRAVRRRRHPRLYRECPHGGRRPPGPSRVGAPATGRIGAERE